MFMRVGRQWLASLFLATAVAFAAASCGSGGNGSTFDPGHADAGADATGSGVTTGHLGCVPKSCAQLGYQCGMNGDGCGGTLDCGACPLGQTCGGGGYSMCGSGGGSSSDGGAAGDSGPIADGGQLTACVPETCQSLNINCGYAGDGCGGVLSCGTCSAPQYCGGGGYNQCGGNSGVLPDGGASSCQPTTCAALGYTCGVAADGCGGVLNCGSCKNPQFCGGGGFDKCGGNAGLLPDGGIQCTPTTCASLGYTCGVAADGCGGVLNCGTCSNPEFCGGGGFNQCGGNNGLLPDGGASCTPETCATLGYTCGVAADGCGGVLNCGSCMNPQFCGGGGFNQCGGNNGLTADGGVGCTPETCATLGYTCGIAGDGCGGVLNCGTCTNPQYCGGGGFNQCGGNDGLTADGGVACTPKTCAQLGYNCGVTGDGCGGVLNCGSCATPQYCGGGGFNVCGGNTGLTADGAVPCTPRTCGDLGYNCGVAGDGCGGVLNCGSCTNPQYCGGGGFNVCGGNDGLTVDGGSTCTPKTCAQLGYTCGVTGDGCGGVLSCGSCTSPQYCGGAGFNVCGGNNGRNPDGSVACTPKTCADLGYTCGISGDGCGGSINCGTCTNPQYCGGGGFNVCGGNNGLTPDGGVACTPTTCAQLGYTCGVTGDGCGGVLNCGSCTSPQYCGGGGFNVCGGNNGFTADGGVACTPKTCAQLGYTCGISGDGCGGSINCGTCTNPQYCGGGGFNVCGGNDGLLPDGGVACTPKTCAQLGYNCGQAADGCGGLLNCGTCTNPQYCGGGGYDVCGGNNGLSTDGGVACTPKTCADLGYTCGAAGDGCGHLLNCGTCTAPQYCGGGGYDLCGPSSISVCDGGATTTVSGFVYDPGDNVPIYNALVYVPIGAVQTPQTGVSPASCGCSAPASYASAYTGIDGSFTITVASNSTATLVVQLGKWQRTFNPTITPCTANQLATHLNLPSTHLQGHIPLFAVDTGNVDTMECVLRKMGIADSEFVDPAISKGTPTAAGRVHMYQGSNVAGGAVIDTATPKESALTETASVMDAYDVILFPCQGGQGNYTGTKWPNTLGNLLNFANSGGRIFATHFSYDLLYKNGTATTGFMASAQWAVNGGSWAGPFTGNIDDQSTFPRGQALANWLHQSSVYGGTFDQIPVSVVRNDFVSAVSPAQEWVYTTNPPDNGRSHMDIHYTFDTPFTAGGTAGTCGRVVFSDFHVEDASSNTANGKIFPKECTAGAMTPQEKLLEFMLFDLTSCVSQPSCTPLTCAQQNISCGPAGDGCGHQLDCGSCTSPQTCGGGGVAGACGYPDGGACVPQTCQSQGIACGPAGDGCGNQLDCGSCASPQTCGGGGVAGQCGYPDGGSCTPRTCQAQGITCGPAGDGCGNQINCGSCMSPQTCGGGGVPGQCGYPDAATCTPSTCAAQHITCGPAGDGCGNLLDCGSCTAPSTCGGGGVAGRCGVPDAATCSPLTCAQQNIACGPAGDGCGNLLDCGSCTAPATCGGGGVAGQCGTPDAATCSPLTCAQQNIACGEASDGCGDLLDCGSCTAPATCGGGGVAGQCGVPASCASLTCAQQNITCGPAGDGCGNLLDCGSCTAPATCGGGGVPGQCGTPVSCVPTSCGSQHITCGPAGDGCGNLLDCGSCVAPETCGGGGIPGRCGAPDASTCPPLTCAQQNIACGPAGDGCGNLLDCGSCVAPATCGGGGVPGQCGYPDAAVCNPTSCAVQNITCGPAGDGCGHLLDCGSCTGPATCGGGGVPGQCGTPDAATCSPLSCAQQHIGCGPTGDGCGNFLNCGSCPTGQTCGGGGVPGQCGSADASACTPRTCSQQNIACGPTGDGCGNLLDCGTCPAGQTCGGGGVSGQCGAPGSGSCVAITCAQQNIACGPAGDGCGNLIQCGTCPSGQTCGGAGVAGQCGTPPSACVPLTCEQQNITCGPAADGCGNLIQCGTCVAPLTCGGGGKPGVCGAPPR